MRRLLFSSVLVGITIGVAVTAAHANSGTGQAACGNDVNISYSPTTLWPPNNKLNTITINATDNDQDHDSFSVNVSSITANCGADSDITGVGHTATGSDPGTVVTSVQLTASKCGDQARVYDIKLNCSTTPASCSSASDCVSGQVCQGGICQQCSQFCFLCGFFNTCCTTQCNPVGGPPENGGTADLTVTVPHDQGQ